MRRIGNVDDAPIKTVSLIFRFTETTNLSPVYGRISRRYSELPVTVDLELETLRWSETDFVKTTLTDATLSVLADVAVRYGLPKDFEKVDLP